MSGVRGIRSLLLGPCRAPRQQARRLFQYRVLSSSGPTEEWNHGDGEHKSSSEGRRRSILMSVAIGSAVAAIGGGYVLYYNHYKLKAQEEASVVQGVSEEKGGEGESSGDKEPSRRTSFRDQRIIAYEDRIRAYSTPDKVFRLFATLKVTKGDTSGIYMTPEDFVRSITPGVKQPEGLGLDEFKKLDEEGFKTWLESYLKEKEQSKEASFFDKLGKCGLLSFSDYLFLLTVLATPKSHFKLAFKMFDLDGDGVLSREEFQEVHKIIKKGTTVGARHRDHAVTGSVATEVSDAVTMYLFGTDKGKQLKYQEFEHFHDELTGACLKIEFNRFEPDENGRITERDFGKLILAHADFEHQEDKKYLKRLKHKFSQEEMEGITYQQVRDFSMVLDDINDIDKALVMYEAGKATLTQDDFKHLAKIVTGVTLDDHVIKVIFALFDENDDGELSHKEFVEVMKKRKTRGLGKKKELGFMRLFNAAVGCGHSVIADLVSSKVSSSN